MALQVASVVKVYPLQSYRVERAVVLNGQRKGEKRGLNRVKLVRNDKRMHAKAHGQELLEPLAGLPSFPC